LTDKIEALIKELISLIQTKRGGNSGFRCGFICGVSAALKKAVEIFED